MGHRLRRAYDRLEQVACMGARAWQRRSRHGCVAASHIRGHSDMPLPSIRPCYNCTRSKPPADDQGGTGSVCVWPASGQHLTRACWIGLWVGDAWFLHGGAGGWGMCGGVRHWRWWVAAATAVSRRRWCNRAGCLANRRSSSQGLQGAEASTEQLRGWFIRPIWQGLRVHQALEMVHSTAGRQWQA